MRNTATSQNPPPTRGLPPDASQMTATQKPRSCVTCRARKVRCDKKTPCSHCARARIACVLPPLDKRPRWANKIEKSAAYVNASAEAGGGVNQMLARLNTLEDLLRRYESQAAPVTPNPSSQLHSESASLSRREPSQVQRLGRLVAGDESQSRYVGTSFWAKINDEISALRVDTRALAPEQHDSSDEDAAAARAPPPTEEFHRRPDERSGFIFGMNHLPNNNNLASLHPLPSQIPFIFNIFHENANSQSQLVDMPTLEKMIRDLPGSDFSALSPVNEALLFSIYYATITSMDDDAVRVNFGASKADLNIKYRVGFERALAKADFMNTSDMTLVQAMSIFLFLARRHDSPRYVWMLTGLVIRMAQALGLQRDGSRFDHLTPFEVEKRRRLWWAVCVLDLRSSEELAMDMTIAQSSFDTRLPLNVNTSDIRPTTQQAPPEKDGLTDMTLPVLWFSQVDVMRRMTFLMAAQGGQAGSSLDEQLSLLGELEDQIQRMYLQYSNPQDSPAYWMAVGVTRIVVSKMTLFVYLPALFSSPANITQDISTKLLVSAIEIAEFNHALNGSRECRPWRWIFQTYTHWHAVVYMLLNAAQQPWSPLIERAWVALHSSWLIPKDTGKALRARTWVPLRQLFSKARAHREAELERLRGDQRAADSLYHEDMALEQPNSPGLGPFPGPMEGMAELFRQRWRQLVTATAESEDVQPQQPQQQQQQQQQGTVVGEIVDQTQLWTESLQLQLDTDMLFPAMSDGGESTYSFSDLDFDADVNAMNWGEWIQYTEEVERSAAAVAATVAR